MGSNKPWTLEDTFNDAQHFQLCLCSNPKYSKLPFNERDQLFAKCYDIKDQAHTASARMGTRMFKDLEERVHPYLRHSSIMKANKLMEIVQYILAWMSYQPEFKDKKLEELTEIIGGWLGKSKLHIISIAIGRGRYKRLSGCVDERIVIHRTGNSKKTSQKILAKYHKFLNYKWFSELPLYKQEEIVGRETNYKPSTVNAVSHCYGVYKKRENLYHKNKSKQSHAEKIRADYLSRIQNPDFAKLKKIERYRILAKEENLSPHTIKAMILGQHAYCKLKSLNDILDSKNNETKKSNVP